MNRKITAAVVCVIGVSCITWGLSRYKKNPAHKEKVFKNKTLLSVKDRKVSKAVAIRLNDGDSDSKKLSVVKKLVRISRNLESYQQKSELELRQNWKKISGRLESYSEELGQFAKYANEKEIGKNLKIKIVELSRHLGAAAKRHSNYREFFGSGNEILSLKLKKKIRANSLNVKSTNMPIKSLSRTSIIEGGKVSGVSRMSTSPGTLTCSHQNIADFESEFSRVGEDIFTARSKTVIQLADKLDSVEAIFSFVKNRIELVPFLGATQVAETTIRARSGTAIDKTSLLIALLRTKNVAARYVAGEVLVEEQTLKRILGVEGSLDLMWALLQIASEYYLEFGTEKMIYERDGLRLWAFPHVWARVNLDGVWVDLDPTFLGDEHSVLMPGLKEVPIEANISNWFFGKDSLGRFVKPGTLMDSLMEQAGPAIRSVFGSKIFLSDIGRRRNSSVVADEIELGTISAVDPCIEVKADSLPVEYQFLSKVVLGDKGSPDLVYEAPTAIFRENMVSLSHSAGLLSDVGAGQVGQLEVAINESVVSTLPADTGSSVDVSHGVISPTRFLSSEPLRTIDMNSVGGVVVFNHSVGRSTNVEVNRELNKLREDTNAGVSRRALMKRFLRLAGVMALARADELTRSLRLLRGAEFYLKDSMTTYTRIGTILDKDDRNFGVIPLGVTIDWLTRNILYSHSGNKLTFTDYENLLNGSREFLISASGIEHSVWEELYGVPSGSAVRAMQLASKFNDEGGLGLDFIDGEELGVGNDDVILSRFKGEMVSVIPNIMDSPANSPNVLLYATTESVGLPTGWRGGGFILLPNEDNLAGSATFITFQEGVGTFGGGTLDEEVNFFEALFGFGFFGLFNNFSGVCGNPVNLSSGTMYHQFVDFDIKGRTSETGIRMLRTYLTKPFSVTGDFGPNWVYNWEARLLSEDSNVLDPQDTGDIFFIDENGGEFLFTRNPAPDDDTFVAPPGVFIELKQFSDRYEISKKNGTVFTFSRTGVVPAGRLESIQEVHGETVTLSYDVQGRLEKISDNLAGDVVFSRDGSGRIIGIERERDGLWYEYSYDAQGQLVSSKDFKKNETIYEYNQEQVGTKAHGLLGAFQDPIKRRVEFVYYDNGRVFKERSFGGLERTYSYSPFTTEHLTRLTGPDGRVTEFRYDDKFRLIETIFPDGSRTRSEWSDDNLRTAAVDELGYKTEFTYDSKGNQTGVKRPEDSGFRKTEFDLVFNKPTKRIPLAGSETEFILDPMNGDVKEVKKTDSSGIVSLQFGYDVFGGVIETANNFSVYSDERNSEGSLTSVFDVRNTERRTYDSRERLKQRIFASGRVISFEYDDFDRTTVVEDTHGPNIVQRYDVVGRLVSRTVTDGIEFQTTNFEYDSRDRLVAVVDPMGRKTVTKYDEVSANGCEVIDRPIAVVDPAGRVTRMAYDERQRLSETVDPEGNRTRFEYNFRGDRTSVTDPEGNKTRFRFDGNRRLVQRVRASMKSNSGGVSKRANEMTRFGYDESDRLIREEILLDVDINTGDETLFVTEFEYNELGRLSRKVVKKTKGPVVLEVLDDSTYLYQRQLDVTRLATARNKIVEYSFEYETQKPFSLIGFSVKAVEVGNPLGIVEGTFFVDPDITGSIGRIDFEGSPLITNVLDGASRLMGINASFLGNSLETVVYRDGFGRKTGVSHSNGLSGSYTYDLLNRITNITWGGAGENFSEGITYDSKTTNISKVVREFGTFDYTYDKTDQLESIVYSGTPTLGNLVNRSFTYDKAGNRVSDTALGSGSFSRNILLQDDQAEYLVDGAGLGQLSQKTSSVDGSVDRFTYFPDGKLKTYKRLVPMPNLIESVSAEYFYGPLGRRVAKKVKIGALEFTNTYTYLAQEDKILLAKDGIGNQSLYIDGGGIDEHLGKISSTEVKGFVTDHLGSVINEDTIGDKPAFGPYGENLGTMPAISDTTDPVRYGFTGRQLDAERSSLKQYSRARVYDMDTGRFGTRDPFGLGAGDVNIYRYAKNSPVGMSDPFGLVVVDLTKDQRATLGASSAPTLQREFNRLNDDPSIIVVISEGVPKAGSEFGSAEKIDNSNFEIILNPGLNPDTFNTTLAHEVQHVSDFTTGSAATEFKAEAQEAVFTAETGVPFLGTVCGAF